MAVRLIDLRLQKHKEIFTEAPDKSNLHPVGRIKTDRGWQTVDSPYDPCGEVRRAISKKVMKGSHILVLGAGSGFLASELLKTGKHTIILITGSLQLGKKNAELFRTCANGSIHCTVIVASQLSDSLITYLQDHLKDKKEYNILYHPRETNIYPALFGPLALFLESIFLPFTKKSSIPPRKVLLACSGQLFEPELHNELILRGIEVAQVDAFTSRHITHRQAWQQIRKYQPDLVLSTNNKGSDTFGYIPQACSLAGIKWATWFLDQPKFSVSEHEITDQQKRFAFCWDIAGVEACNELKFGAAELLPLATNTKHFTPGDGKSFLHGKIVYVGSPSFGNERKYFAGLLRDPKAHLIAKAFEQQIWQERTLPTHDAMVQMITSYGLCDHFTGNTLKRLPAFALFKANLSYRIAALTYIADLQPIVYGDGWQGLLPETIQLHGYADYYRDLRSIYRSDAVHLSLTHLQMRHYPNQRIFDAGACSRIVLGERLDGWHELFGNEFDDLTFKDFKELYEKALMLKNCARKRKKIGESLRDLILRKHTIADRIDSMFDVLGTA